MAITFNPLEGQFDIIVKDHLLLDNVGTNTHSQIDDHLADNSQAHSDYLINNGDDTTSGILTAKGFKSTNTTDLTVNEIDLSETINSIGGFAAITGNKIKGTFAYEDGVAGGGLFLNSPIVDLSTTLTKGIGFLVGTNLAGKAYYNFSATESTGVVSSNPIFKISYTGPNSQNSDGVFNVAGTSTVNTGEFIACKTTAQNSGNATTIGYRGWAQGTGTSTATLIGVEGYAVPISTAYASVAVQGNPKPVGTLVADKIMAFRAAAGHILGYGGKTSLILTTSATRPIDVTPNHADFLNNTSEIYADGLAEIHGVIYGDNTTTSFEGLGDIRIKADSKKFIAGAGSDMEMYYNGIAGIIDTGVVAPSDLLIDCGTNKTLELQETVWDDWQGQLSSNQATNPSAHIVFNNSEASVTFKTNCDTGDYVYMNPQMQHSWKLGTDIEPHLHWWQTTAAQPNWLIQYRWQRNGSAKTTAWTNVALTSNAFTYSSGTLCQITSGASITPPSGYSISDIIQFRIIRDVANTSGAFAGAESSSVDADAVSFDYHYEIDTMGSRQEFVK